MATTGPPTQVSGLPSFVEALDKRKSHAQDSDYNISYSSDPPGVAFTFNGTQAGAFGFIHFNDASLQVSITGTSGTFSNLIQPTPDQTSPSQFNITDSLPCDEYNVTFILSPSQSMHIDHFSSVPCQTSADPSQHVPTVSISITSVETPTSALAASTSQHSLSAGLIAGLVLSSLLLLMLCGIVLLFFIRRRRRRRQCSGSGSGSWSRIPGHWGKQSLSAPAFLSVGNDGGVSEVPPKTQFGLYMFKFKPPPSPAVTPEPSSSLPATATEPPPRPMPATPQGWFDANREKPPRYSHGDWVADPDSEMGGLVVRGYLPDSKEWTPPQGGDQGDDSSESGTVPTNHAVEFVPRI